MALLRNLNEGRIIALFRDAAQAHLSVNWFNAGRLEYIFSDQHDEEFPAVYLQTLSGSLNDQVQSYSFRMYVFDVAATEPELNHRAFEYDTNLIVSRDTSIQILKDLVGDVVVANRQTFGYTFDTDFALGDRENEGQAGWAVSFTMSYPSALSV